MASRSAAIIIENGSVLLVRRIKEGREYWVLPGGSIEPGESHEEACRREVREETGLDVCTSKHVATLLIEGRRESYYLASVSGGNLEL